MFGWTFLEVRNHVFLQQKTRWFQWFCVFYPESWGRWNYFDEYLSKGWLNHHLDTFSWGGKQLASVVLEASSKNRNTATNLKRNHHHWETSKQMFFLKKTDLWKCQGHCLNDMTNGSDKSSVLFFLFFTLPMPLVQEIAGLIKGVTNY